MASCRCRGEILRTFKSLAAFPASSSTYCVWHYQMYNRGPLVNNQALLLKSPESQWFFHRDSLLKSLLNSIARIQTSAVRYSRMAAQYTAAVPPTLPKPSSFFTCVKQLKNIQCISYLRQSKGNYFTDPSSLFTLLLYRNTATSFNLRWILN